jgi:hypothetical protein
MQPELPLADQRLATGAGSIYAGSNPLSPPRSLALPEILPAQFEAARIHGSVWAGSGCWPLQSSDIDVTINLRGLLPADAQTASKIDLRNTRLIPVQLKRRGIETRLIIPGEPTAVPRSDPALLRALARGYHWFQSWGLEGHFLLDRSRCGRA